MPHRGGCQAQAASNIDPLSWGRRSAT